MGAYSRILLPWDSQPQGPADLDPHWIARGLSFLSLGNGLYWSRNTDWRGASTLTGAPRRLGGKYDLSNGFGTTSGGGTTDRISTGIFLPYSTGFRSIVSFRYANSTGGGGFGRIFNPAGSSGVAANDEALFPNAAINGMAYSKSGSTAWQWGATTPIVTGVWACDGLTHDQRSTAIAPTMYLNGLSVAVTTIGAGGGSYPTTGGLTIDLGNRSTDSTRGWDGILGPLAIFDHASAGLTDQEHRSLFDNPWQLVAPRSIWVPVSASAPAPSPTRSIVEVKVPWDSQPQEAVGIDWDNPLTQGLCALYNPAAGLVNLVTGRAVTKSGNIEATVSSGKAWIMSATTNIVSDVVPALEQGPNKNLGFFMVGPIATTATNTASRIFHYGDSLFGAGYFVTGGSSGRTDASVGTGVVINLTGSVACFDGNANTRYGHNWRDGVGWEAYRGGALLESFAQVSSRATPTTSNLWLLNRDTANRPIGIGSGFTLFGAWNRALSAQEHKSLSDNPWQLFAPRSIWVPVSAGASGTTVTGNLGTASASGYTATIGANRLVAGALGTATASGYTSTVGVNKSVAGIVGVANAIGYQATISTTSDTTVNGVLGTASASGYTATIGANKLIASVLGTATATGYTATVANTNDTTVNSNLGVAAATGFTATIGANRTVAGVVGVATAVGFTATVVAGGSPVYSENSGLWLDIGSKLSLPLDPPRMPNWNTAGRPSAPQDYEYGFNTTTGAIEVWTGSAWV